MKLKKYRKAFWVLFNKQEILPKLYSSRKEARMSSVYWHESLYQIKCKIKKMELREL